MSFIKRLFSRKKKEENETTNKEKRSGAGKERSGYSRKEPTKEVPHRKPSHKQQLVRAARIENISAPERIKEGEILKILVSGHFPDLGWKIDDSFATIKGNEIIVTIVGKRKTGMMAGQALKPFSKTIEVKNIKPGDYQIKAANGPAEVKMVTVEAK